METSCLEEGFKTIWKEIFGQETKIQPKYFCLTASYSGSVRKLWFNIRLCRSKSVSICEAFKELNHMLSHLNRTCTFKYLKQPTFWVQGGIQGEKRQEEAFLKGGN